MAKPTMTGPARLNLILEWLNGVFDEHHFDGRGPEPTAVWTDYAAVRRAVADFVRSFDGTAGAAHLEVVADAAPVPKRRSFIASERAERQPTDEELSELEVLLQIMLEQGFGDPTLKDLSVAVPSLRFAVRGTGRRPPARRGSVIDGGVATQRAYRAPGAYVLTVQGPTLELVPFLLMQLLTAPDMVSVKRCERQGCPHFVITAAAKRGRPQRFCSAACREWNRELTQRQKARRKRQ